MVKVLKGKTLEEQLWSLGLFEEKTERWLHHSLQLPRGVSGEEDADILSLVTSDRTHGNGVKLHQGKFRLDTRKGFITKWSVMGLGCRWKWSRHHGCQSSRSI